MTDATSEKKMLTGAEYAKRYVTEWCGIKLFIEATSISCGVYQIHKLDYMNGGIKNRTHGNDHIIHALDRCVPAPSSEAGLGFFKESIANTWRKCAFFIFSDNNKRANGIAFAKFITDNKLGVVTETSEAKINPNSSNTIRIWTWAPDHEAVRKCVDSHTWGVGVPDQLARSNSW